MYSPVILALQNREFHNLDISKVKFKEINVDEDSIVAEPLTREATEKAHIKARGMEKTFNVFVKGAKFIKSLSDPQAVYDLQKVHNRVLRDYMILFEKDALHGDGGNNGLLNSADPFYVTNETHNIPAIDGNGFNRVQDLNNLVNALKLQVSNKTSSSDVKIFVYGDDLIKFMGSITEDNETSVRDIVKKAYPEAMFIEIPSLALTAEDGNGFVVVSDDATTLHVTTEPTIKNQGTNDEDDYYYAHYVTGSVQVTPDLEGAIIKQAVTFA
jgi:hypothetical protein